MPSEVARSARTFAILSILFILSFSLVPGGPCVAAEANPLPIGATAPDFNLPGVDDKSWSLQDFSNADVLVVIFTCNHCPTAQAYEDRIIKLHDEYKDRRVAIVTISPNDPQAVRLDELGYSDLGDSFEDMKLRVAQKNFPFPYLYDGDKQQVSRAFGVLATPHVFIFDRARTLRYVGAVDDNERAAPKVLYVRDAIEDLLAGRAVGRETTRVFGCSTKWSDKRESARQSILQWEKEPVTLSPIDADAVRKLAANESDKYRLINVWATWCVPCVNELPELVTINRMYRKRPFELITISIDSPTAQDQALKMLQEKRVAATNFIFQSDDRNALADALDKQWQGPVPYTVLIAPGGEVVYRHANSVEPLELKRAIVERLGRTYK